MKLLFFVNRTLDRLLSKAYFPLGEISAFIPFCFQEYYNQARQNM